MLMRFVRRVGRFVSRIRWLKLVNDVANPEAQDPEKCV